MTNATRSKPAVKRTCNLHRGVLTITVDGEASEYSLERIPSDFGDGFQLAKHVGSASDETPVYHVNLSDEGHLCDCKGSIYGTSRTGKACRHVASLVALRMRGRI